MTVTEPERRSLPFARPNVLDLAPLYEVLRREGPIAPVTTPAGDPAWLATRYDEVRDLLGDKRLGRSHPDPEHAARVSSAAVLDGPTGEYETEEADHTRMRRLLTPAFSAKRMRLLSDYVQALTDRCVEAMIADVEAGGVTDLHERLSLPVPIAMICRLLGVPEEDAELFRDLSNRMASYSPDNDAHAAREAFQRYMIGLAEAKRAEPGEDVISDLVTAQENDEDYDYTEMIKLAVGLLFAGHETTVNRIGLGVLFLMTRPEWWQWLVEDPDERTDACVEEIMRLGAPGDLGLLRYAHVDVEVEGATIRAGEAVILSINAANRDPEAYGHAETFDPEREERAHLGFGHGAHFCIGASLARTELRTVFRTLARRMPTMHLTQELDDVAVRTDHLTGGVTALPVALRARA